ncbi:MAG: sulfate permease [Thermodesulfovibrionales bacterium]|nr:sulfate permease [Thermodesulfovibrionales bacterium]
MRFKPKILTKLKGYNLDLFTKDLIAGIIVGIIALPLAIAFGIASGVSPEKGLYTAIVAGFLISFLGGSSVQIGGPTGAFVVIVYGIVHKYGMTGLSVATIMAGVILIIMGLVRMGGLMKFIADPVITGFTSGIAVIIFSSQIKDFLGLPIENLPADFLDKWEMYFEYLNQINYKSMLISILSIGIVILWPRINKKIPGPLVAIIAATLIVKIWDIDVETIGKRFGEIPSSLHAPEMPKFSIKLIKELIFPSITIALLAGIESLLSAVVADGMIGGRHRANTELIAQGIANIASPVFGGIPATGAIARTAANVKNGGRTPVAGIVHAATLLLIMLIFGRWAGMIPFAALSAILVIVAYNMSERKAFAGILRTSKSNAILMLSTFLLTIILDLTIAIQAGVIMSAFIFMKKMSDIGNISYIKDEWEDKEEAVDANEIRNYVIPECFEVYEISGPFFFATINKFRDAISFSSKKTKTLILRMRHVPYVDTAAVQLLTNIYKTCKKQKVVLIIVETQPAVYQSLKRYGFVETIGSSHFFDRLQDVLDFTDSQAVCPKYNETDKK